MKSDNAIRVNHPPDAEANLLHSYFIFPWTSSSFLSNPNLCPTGKQGIKL